MLVWDGEKSPRRSTEGLKDNVRMNLEEQKRLSRWISEVLDWQVKGQETYYIKRVALAPDSGMVR
jgi:hypothetical protein